MIYNLFGFAEVHFSIVLGNDVIMMSFLSHGSKFAYFVELRRSYQLTKFQFCRLSLASFIDKFRKHNDDVIMTSFYVVGI